MKMQKRVLSTLLIILVINVTNGGHHKDFSWVGGPLHTECDYSAKYFLISGQYVKENVIVIKAVGYGDDIYVVSPRIKRGVLATLWLVVQGRRGVELEAFPNTGAHNVGDCDAIQNAVDVYLDHLGNLWILDTGIVDTSESPRCTCSPKVVEISILLKKITKRIDLSKLTQPTSTLQNIVVEYELGLLPYIYVSDSSRGAILVHDVSSGAEWTVLACPPSAGLQLVLMKRGILQTALVLVRIPYPGLLEVDTTSLRRKNSVAALKVIGGQSKPLLLLGSHSQHIYLRHTHSTDVLSWDNREAYQETQLKIIHSPGPRLSTTSVSVNALKNLLIVLDSNYGETVNVKFATYHRISYIDKF